MSTVNINKREVTKTNRNGRTFTTGASIISTFQNSSIPINEYTAGSGISIVDNQIKFSGNYTGDTIFTGNLNVVGNIFQSGAFYETHIEQIYSTKDFINLREGAYTGLFSNQISGFKIMLADGYSNTIFGTDNK